MRVRSLHIHPVKAMRAVDMSRANVEARGLAGDRRWLAVDNDGRFLTQRTHPKLAKIDAAITASGLTLSVDGEGSVDIATPDGAGRRKVMVWDAEIDAAVADPAAHDVLSEWIGDRAQLVYMDEKALRFKESIWTPEAAPVSFADAFPVLMTTTGSLAALNDDIAAHGGDPVPMARFRPNVVIACDDAWAEDEWKTLMIGDVILDLVKPSDRCIVTTTDQRSGKRMGKEPLASLARIHRSTDPRINGVIFGQNAVPRALGEIAVGDPVEVVA